MNFIFQILKMVCGKCVCKQFDKRVQTPSWKGLFQNKNMPGRPFTISSLMRKLVFTVWWRVDAASLPPSNCLSLKAVRENAHQRIPNTFTTFCRGVQDCPTVHDCCKSYFIRRIFNKMPFFYTLVTFPSKWIIYIIENQSRWNEICWKWYSDFN